MNNDTIAKFVSDRAEEFLSGDSEVAEFRDDLLSALILDGEIVVSDGPLRGEGRLSFGRSREGDDGVGLWIPESALPLSEDD